jgi:hypothetical protein
MAYLLRCSTAELVAPPQRQVGDNARSQPHSTAMALGRPPRLPWCPAASLSSPLRPCCHTSEAAPGATLVPHFPPSRWRLAASLPRRRGLPEEDVLPRWSGPWRSFIWRWTTGTGRARRISMSPDFQVGGAMYAHPATSSRRWMSRQCRVPDQTCSSSSRWPRSPCHLAAAQKGKVTCCH